MSKFDGPVYRVQCQTASIAREISGATGNAMRLDLESAIQNPDSAPALFSFRALPGFRSQDARALRRIVATVVRRQRRKR